MTNQEEQEAPDPNGLDPHIAEWQADAEDLRLVPDPDEQADGSREILTPTQQFEQRMALGGTLHDGVTAANE